MQRPAKYEHSGWTETTRGQSGQFKCAIFFGKTWNPLDGVGGARFLRKQTHNGSEDERRDFVGSEWSESIRLEPLSLLLREICAARGVRACVRVLCACT